MLLLWVRGAAFSAAKVKLGPEEPKWHRCKRKTQVAFLEEEVWGQLKWALESKDVQVIDAFDLELEDEKLLITFPLEAYELDFGLGGAAFLLSIIDNVIVTGPHYQEDLETVWPVEAAESTKKSGVEER